MRPRRYILLWLSLLALWLPLSGHPEPLIVAFGVGSAALVTFISARMDRVDRYVFPVRLSWRMPGYLAWLVKEMFKANVRVARIILHPALPISPIMVPFRSRQQSDPFRVLYANSITLTPGTMTTGTQGHILRIHALTWEDVDGRDDDEMDRRVCALEDGS
jgi:multicomponent Na+:H+ antiporter subunit E